MNGCAVLKVWEKNRDLGKRIRNQNYSSRQGEAKNKKQVKTQLAVGQWSTTGSHRHTQACKTLCVCKIGTSPDKSNDGALTSPSVCKIYDFLIGFFFLSSSPWNKLVNKYLVFIYSTKPVKVSWGLTFPFYFTIYPQTVWANWKCSSYECANRQKETHQ